MNIADVDGDATLYFIGQIARALVPLVTSAAAFGLGWECNHHDRLAVLEAERLKLLDLKAETAMRSVIRNLRWRISTRTKRITAWPA